MSNAFPEGRVTADPDDPIMKQSSNELRRRKAFHTTLMVIGWVNISMGVTLLLVSILVAFLIPLQYAVSPCGNSCVYNYLVPITASFVTFVVALIQFWAADTLEADKYCETGMWISLVFIVPFVVFFAYIIIRKVASQITKNSGEELSSYMIQVEPRG